MKIGFDAKWFFSGNPSGRVVVRNILKQLLIKYPEHDFYIFLKSSEKDLPFPFTAPNVHRIYVWGKINLISNIIFLPLRALFLPLDVCFFQYSAPPISFFKRVVYIYDVIFEDAPNFFSFLERIYFTPYKFLAMRAHRICTISESEKKRLIYHSYGRKDKIDVVHLGVEKTFKPRGQISAQLLERTKTVYKLPEEFLLYLGRLNERKNLHNLLKAVTLLTNVNIKLVLAGSYQGKMEDLTSLIRDFHLEARVILTGYVADEMLPALYSLAKIFCYVSYDEGFGFPPLEAMASGVPVVVANTGALPEICGEAGNYVNPRDPLDIAKMIDSLLQDDLTFSKKRTAGIQRAEFFSWEKSATELFHSIQKLFNKSDEKV